MNTLGTVLANNAPHSNHAVRNPAAVLVLTALVAGCATKNLPTTSPFDLLGPLVNAPIMAAFSAFGISPDDGMTTLPELHRNPRALEGLDLPSQVFAQRNLAYALEQGRLRVGVYWENPANHGGRAAGAAIIIQDMTHEDGRRCRDVLIETEMEGEPTDKRLLTYCPSEAGWLIAD